MNPESHTARYVISRCPHGGPVRDVLNLSPMKHVGFIYSHKLRRAVTFESYGEEALLLRLEVNADVVEFQSQPFWLTIPLEGGGTLRHCPDVEAVFGDGTRKVFEERSNVEPRDDADAVKRRALEGVCNKLDWSFELKLRSALEAEPSFGAVKRIALNGATSVDQREVDRIYDLIERGGATYANAIEEIGSGGEPKLHAMVVCHGVHLHLERGLTPDAPIRRRIG